MPYAVTKTSLVTTHRRSQDFQRVGAAVRPGWIQDFWLGTMEGPKASSEAR